jgi:hypothetical protein
VLSWRRQPGGGALTLHLQPLPPLHSPFPNLLVPMATDSPNICPHLEPAEGGAPQHHLRGGPAIRAPSPPQAVSLPHPPPRAPPRLSGDQRTRVSAVSAVRPQPPPWGSPRGPGPSSYLDIAGPVSQYPWKSQGSEVSAERAPGPFHLCEPSEVCGFSCS